MQMQCDALQDKSTRLLVEERATRASILPNLNESRISIRLQSSSTGSSRGHYLKSISLRRADQTTSVDSGKASHQSTAAWVRSDVQVPVQGSQVMPPGLCAP
ncbi:hypothetical protein SNK03_012734 [Fusarium graminearum]|jgi:hypothetical protein